MNKSNAIKKARNRIGEIYSWGGQYRFNYWDVSVNAWRESTPEYYFNAVFHRSQELIYEAMRFLGYDQEICYNSMANYCNGKWTDHLNDMIKKY